MKLFENKSKYPKVKIRLNGSIQKICDMSETFYDHFCEKYWQSDDQNDMELDGWVKDKIENISKEDIAEYYEEYETQSEMVASLIYNDIIDDDHITLDAELVRE